MNVLIDYFFVIGPSSEDGHHPKVSINDNFSVSQTKIPMKIYAKNVAENLFANLI